MALNAQNNCAETYKWQKCIILLDKPLTVSQYNATEMTAGKDHFFPGCLT